MKRVVISGVGVASSIGLDFSTFSKSLYNKQHGFCDLSQIPEIKDLSMYFGNYPSLHKSLKSQCGALVDYSSIRKNLNSIGINPQERTLGLSLYAAYCALKDAGIDLGDQNTKKDIAVIWGSGNGPTTGLEDSYRRFNDKGYDGVRPMTVPKFMHNALSANISMKFGLSGSNFTVSSACTSSTIAIGLGYQLLISGKYEKVLVGGGESLFTPALFSAWDKLGVLKPGKDPDAMLNPFCKDRNGFFLGEGAGALLLERNDYSNSAIPGDTEESSDKNSYGFIAGFGDSSDAHHLTQPDPQGQKKALATCLKDADLKPNDIHWISLHATATQGNDACEAETLSHIFGSDLTKIPCHAPKTLMGHTLGAAGILESISCLAVLRNKNAPPIRYSGDIDSNPNLKLPLQPEELGLSNEPTKGPLYALKQNFGFGGSNAALILGK